ncbi:MAG: PQQ-binding-like beta-propeller repeat protein [Vicinamibacterales bacterium]
MLRFRIALTLAAITVVSLVSLGSRTLTAQAVRTIGPGDWPLHNLDGHNSRYSPLTQITPANASKLAVKWQFDLPKGSTLGSATPIVLGGIMYVNSGRQVFAIDAATGTQIWTTEPEGDFKPGGRGPAYADGKIFVTGQSMLAAFNAENGKPVEGFGKGGVLHLTKAALDAKEPGKYPADFDPYSIGYMIASSPTYANGTIYMGLAQADSLVPGGLITAIDAATGAIKWVWRTIPQGPGDDGWELAKDTWSGELRYGGGIWTQPSIDTELGLLYANVSNPSPNYDGSSRKGINLFTNSVVALDLATGKLRWHFQVIHHDIWDWDLVTGPTLFDITVNGQPVKALASLAKTCYVYLFNRATGQPIHPIVETPVPTRTDMPGEQPWPTQPIPYSARHVPQQPFCSTFPNIADPELAKRRRPSFTPYSINEFYIQSPGLLGGPNRGSSAFSPKTGLLYVTGKNDAWSIKAKPVGSSIKPAPGSPGHFQVFQEEGPTGVKATQNVAAFNPVTGDVAWVTELAGTTNGGNLVTAGDVVYQAINRDFYALDARTGKPLAKVQMKTAMSATPLAYSARKKDFVAIASGSTVVAIGVP